jgi:hypothetical protein
LIISTIGFSGRSWYRSLSDFAVGQRKVFVSVYVLQGKSVTVLATARKETGETD